VLLDRGADVNAKRNDDTTPLHLAASRGRTEIVKLLLDRGADVNAKDTQGSTPLHWVSAAIAQGRNRDKVRDILEEHGGRVSWCP
jgi:ankyrin repeat protein